MPGYQYTFIVQCKELINHAQSRVVATMKIENDDGAFMKALDGLNKNPKCFKQIYIGDIDLEQAPTMEPEKKLDND